MIRTALLLLATTGPAVALDLAECTRITHVSHGGEARHQDIGQGWVSWIEWWSQEGVYTDLHVADCQAQRVVVSRLREEYIRDRQFDRRDDGLEVFDRHLRRSPAFYSLNDLAEELARISPDTRLEDQTKESCACAAAYPDARGALEQFALN